MDPTPKLLTPKHLVERWEGAVSERTLGQWRYLNKGPTYIKLGNKVRYKIQDVLDYEKEQTK